MYASSELCIRLVVLVSLMITAVILWNMCAGPDLTSVLFLPDSLNDLLCRFSVIGVQKISDMLSSHFLSHNIPGTGLKGGTAEVCF